MQKNSRNDVHHFHQIIYFRMAEASTIGFTTDSVDGKSSTMHAASDELIDPYCELCYETKGEKVASRCFCKECNLCLCISCNDVHKQVPSLQRHQILHGSRMPRSIADKPIKYPDCELHSGTIKDRYCREHHKMLCSECLKQNHQRCHVDTITDLCKILGSDDIKSFTAVIDDIKLNVYKLQSKLHKNKSDLTKERENEIKRAEQAKQNMIQKANEMFNETVSGITKHYHNKVGEIKSHIVKLNDELHHLDEIINKLNRKVSIKFDPNLFIEMQQIVNTTQTCKREIGDMISEIKTTKISFSFSKEISDFLSCTRFGDVQEMSSPLNITDDVEDIFFPYITLQAERKYIKSQAGGTPLEKKDVVDICHILARKLSHIDITSQEDENEPYKTRLAVTDNGTLLVSDCYNGTLKVFSQDTTLLSSVPLSDWRSFGVTVTEDDIAVVSTGDENLYCLDITDPSSVSVQSSLKIGCGVEVDGITTYKDKLVVTTCVPRGVIMLDMNGETVWSVDLSDYEHFLIAPIYAVTSKINDTETVIVSDCTKETLTLLNANNGALLKIVDMEGKEPYGITVDSDGNIFVACAKPNGICVWSNDFTKSRTLISQKDLEMAPGSIAYSSSTNTLYIGFHDPCDYIERFQLSMADQ